MSAKTQNTSRKTAARDAYDDFLDGIVTPAKKAASGKSASKKSSPKKSSSEEGASAKKKTSAGKTSSEKKTQGKRVSSAGKASSAKKSSGAKKAVSSDRKKSSSARTQSVEAGIVSLGARDASRGTAAKHARKPAEGKSAPAGKHSAKPSASRKANAVFVVDNPVAGGERTRRRREEASSGRGNSVRGKRSASHAGDRARRMERDDGYRKAHHSSKSRAKSSNRKKHSSKKRRGLSGWDIFFSAGIICMLGFMIWQGTQYSDFLMMKQAVDRQTYYAGTTIEGVDVSGMTLEGAMNYWQTEVEPWYADRTVVFEDGESVKASQLGYTSDYLTVLTNAWSTGRSGSLEERYRAIASREATPVAYSVTRVPYTETMIDRFTAYAAEKVDRPATEAKIESFDLKKFEFVFTEPQPGKKLDQEAFKNSVMQALDAGGGSVKTVIADVEPAVSKKDVASQYGMITSAITNASSSSKNRLANIKLSLELINGTCLKPGETFSFNGVVGERTKARGFKEATAYSSGEVTEQVGGGICQVSTTLFNAAVKADLKINERHNHSLTVGYVDLGKDAAVNWGSQDLRFTNNTGDDIYICCYLTKDKRVRFGIFGKLIPNGETITVEGVTTGEIEYETEYQASGLLVPGEQVVLQTGKKGYTAEAYKMRWNASGKLISRDLLCKSKYKAVKEIIQYGP